MRTIKIVFFSFLIFFCSIWFIVGIYTEKNLKERKRNEEKIREEVEK